MAKDRSSFWRRHRWLTILAGVSLAAVLVCVAVLALVARHLEPFLRTSLIAGLSDRFHTRVELDTFHVSLGNGFEGEWGIWATGRGLRVWPPHREGGDHPLEVSVQSLPLLELGEFRFHVPLRYRSGKPVTISRVKLIGLKVDVPPRSERDRNTGFESAVTSHKPSPSPPAGPHRTGLAAALPQPGTLPAPSGQIAEQPGGDGMLGRVLIRRIECDNAQLILETDKPDKLPLSFVIAHLMLKDVTAGAPMTFEAELTNPKPRGLIHTSGKLGPWQGGDVGETPLSGFYGFDHADLATFKGIAGTLASTGNYQGTLRELIVDGRVDVPDFRLPRFGNPLPLHTVFHARVDGTDGDTWLDPVDATLGHSHFTTVGQVVRVKPRNTSAGQPVVSANIPPLADHGHMIDLKVIVDRGRIEDFLRLANHSQTPVLTGTVMVKATLHIPPGSEPAHQRMRLDGTFKLDQAHFTNEKLQKRIHDLSLRGQGHPEQLKSADTDGVSSEMEGEFHMADAVILLPDLQYNVPGAAIRLNGKYALEGFMHFEGTARMQATVSQMVGGWKGLLLKPADRFFKKDGAGTLVPIAIRGTHDAPEFSVDFGRLKSSSPQSPGRRQ